MSAIATVRAAEGLSEYLALVEHRLAEVVGRYPGLVASIGRDALDAGGKRLRPTLSFLSAPDPERAPVAAGVAVELVHMATLVHDDLVDRARVRRGRTAAWAEHGDRAAVAGGDNLFALAFAELADRGSLTGVRVLADASLALARGEALQRQQRHDADTPVEAYLERVRLKTGKLFEAACELGGGSARYGSLLGIAFQIADDILDCTGDTHKTGKIPGTDLRDGTPTLPLLLAAREDAVVRAALAGGSLEGALVRVAATGALDESREIALGYAAQARAAIGDLPRRAELAALTELVVDRSA